MFICFLLCVSVTSSERYLWEDRSGDLWPVKDWDGVSGRGSHHQHQAWGGTGEPRKQNTNTRLTSSFTFRAFLVLWEEKTPPFSLTSPGETLTGILVLHHEPQWASRQKQNRCRSKKKNHNHHCSQWNRMRSIYTEDSHNTVHSQILLCMCLIFQGIYIKSTYDGLHVITGTTENVSVALI